MNRRRRAAAHALILAMLATSSFSRPVKADPPLDAARLVALALTLPDCPQEDSRNCVWIAATRGNGRGLSFVDVDGNVYPLPSPCALAALAPTDSNLEACTGQPVRLD